MKAAVGRLGQPPADALDHDVGRRDPQHLLRRHLEEAQGAGFPGPARVEMGQVLGEVLPEGVGQWRHVGPRI